MGLRVKVWREAWPTRLIIEIADEDLYRERSKTTGKMGGSLMPTKNRAHGTRRDGGKYITPRQAHFRRLIQMQCGGLETGLGPYSLGVLQVCRQTRKVGDIAFPQPDSDATLTAVRDAIQARPGWRGIIVDDAQIVSNKIKSEVSTSTPRKCSMRIELERVNHGA